MTIKVSCPICGKPHDLFYYVGKDGKRVPSVICNRVATLDAHHKATTSTKRIEVPNQPLDFDIRVEWSSGYAKDQRGKKKLQLPLMINQNKNHDTD